MGVQGELDTIDQAMLTPLVRRVLKSETIEILDWHYSQVHGGAGDVGGVISGIYRFAGNGVDRGETIPWSLILKIIGSATGNDDPAEPRYWKRELLAYQSGQLGDLPGGLAAPQCYDIVERSEREAWLWLENITDEVGPQWPLEQYGLAARHLGQFNGAYLTQETPPSWCWLSRGWLRALVYRAEPGIAQLRRSPDHPLVSRWFPPEQANRVFKLWAERELFLNALERLPQTVCHRDAHRRNLLTRSPDGCAQTVAVDWAFAGIGAIGEEINSLVNASLAFSEVAFTEANAMDDMVFSGYVTGLKDAGWEGDPRLVRLGYTAASALCFTIGYSLGDGLPLLLDENGHAWMEQAFGHSMETLVDLWAEGSRFQLDLADEARDLLGEWDHLKG